MQPDLQSLSQQHYRLSARDGFIYALETKPGQETTLCDRLTYLYTMAGLVRDSETTTFHNHDNRIANQTHQQIIHGGQHFYP